MPESREGHPRAHLHRRQRPGPRGRRVRRLRHRPGRLPRHRHRRVHPRLGPRPPPRSRPGPDGGDPPRRIRHRTAQFPDGRGACAVRHHPRRRRVLHPRHPRLGRPAAAPVPPHHQRPRTGPEGHGTPGHRHRVSPGPTLARPALDPGTASRPRTPPRTQFPAPVRRTDRAARGAHATPPRGPRLLHPARRTCHGDPAGRPVPAPEGAPPHPFASPDTTTDSAGR